MLNEKVELLLVNNLSIRNYYTSPNFITLYLLEKKYNYTLIIKSTSYIVMIVIEIHVSSICKTANNRRN